VDWPVFRPAKPLTITSWERNLYVKLDVSGMAPTPETSAPLGIKVVAGWAVITGIALLVLGFTQTPWYVPLGMGALIAAYGLWTLQFWGLVLAGVVLAIEGAQDVIEGAIIELVVVLLVLGYLYTQRHQSPA
jgi:hypothetical protein